MHKYFLLDRGILVGYKMTNAKIEVNQITKDTANNPLFKEEYFAVPPKKWEVRYDNGYPNIIYDALHKKFRCYYTMFTYDESSAETPLKSRAGVSYAPKSSRITSLGYAESTDGIHFTKPSLGLVEFEGSKDNNILMLYAHGTGVFLDEQETDMSKRYKLLTKVEYNDARSYMAVAFSADGINFTGLTEWPQHNPAADSHNFVFRDVKTNKFVLLTRIWRNGVRICAKCESEDFINWSKPTEVLRGSGFENEVYSMPAFYYDGIYLGLASIYHNGDTTADNFDNVDLELKYTANLNAWDSVAQNQYIITRGEGKYPDGEFDCGCIYAAAPVIINNKIWIYYMGGNGQHTNFRETALARGYLEKDKFAGYVQKNKEAPATVLTANFYVYGNELYILADIYDGGSLKVALGKKNGAVHAGFEAESCRLEKQEDGYYKITFKDKNIIELRTKPVSLHISFNNAKVYAIKGDCECCMLKY